MTVFLALLSVAVGALLGGVVNATVGRYASFKETQALAASIRAELESMLALVKLRRHVENLEQTITYLTGLTRPPGPSDFYDTGDASQDAYPVFHANCGKIGLLGDAAESVVSAYTRLKAVGGDLAQIRERHQRLPLTLEQIVTVHAGIKNFMVDAVKRAEIAVAKLHDFERQCFLWRRSSAVIPSGRRDSGEDRQ